jgi:hypothetical protein
VSWRRIVVLAVPLAVLVFALGFIVGLEVRRGPDWRLELDAYLARHTTPSETVTVEAVTRARRPERFRASMGTPQEGDWIKPSSPAQAVRCALLLRRRPADDGTGGEEVRQVLFLVHQSDALYRVGWLAYEGPSLPFGPQLLENLASIGCDLPLDAFTGDNDG